MAPRFDQPLVPASSDISRDVSLQPLVSEDLPAQIGSLSSFGEPFEIRTAGTIRWPAFTTTTDNEGGSNNHIQGIAVLEYPRRLLLSGSDELANMAVLFCAAIGSSSGFAGIASNIVRGDPPLDDAFIHAYDLSQRGAFFHAGGISTLGHVCAVPLESKDTSSVVLLDLLDDTQPLLLRRATIDRGRQKAGASALTMLPNGRLLLAIWSDGEKTGPERHLDLYISQSQDPAKADWTRVQSIPQLQWQAYQALAFIWNRTLSNLFLLGTSNNKQTAPLTSAGTNTIDVFRLKIDGRWDQLSATQFPEVTFETLLSRVVPTEKRYADFRAGAGLHVGHTGRLSVLATGHYLTNAKESTMSKTGASPPVTLRCSEYRSVRGNSDSITSTSDSFLELYEDADFGTRRFTLFANDAASVSDYKSFEVYGETMRDHIGAVVFQLPVGDSFLLFPSVDFGGTAVELRGTGRIEKLRSLADVQMPKGPRSSKRVSQQEVAAHDVRFVHPL